MKATTINTNLTDLHPDDQAARVWLRDFLVARRDEEGLLNREIAARVGHSDGWAYNILATTSWKLETIQLLARALGYRLGFTTEWIGAELTLQGVTAREEMWETAYSRYIRSPNPARRDEAERIDLCDWGRRCREAQGLSPTLLGYRLGMEGKSVRAWENGERPGYMLVTAQRYFRALGGQLVPTLAFIEADGEEPKLATFVPPKPRAAGTSVRIQEFEDRTVVWNADAPQTVVSFPAEEWRQWILEAGDEPAA